MFSRMSMVIKILNLYLPQVLDLRLFDLSLYQAINSATRLIFLALLQLLKLRLSCSSLNLTHYFETLALNLPRQTANNEKKSY